MTALSEAFDHLVYWWDRLTSAVCGSPTDLASPVGLTFLDPISGRSWIWTAGEFIRTPDADVPPAGER